MDIFFKIWVWLCIIGVIGTIFTVFKNDSIDVLDALDGIILSLMLIGLWVGIFSVGAGFYKLIEWTFWG